MMNKDQTQTYSPLFDVCDVCGRGQAGQQKQSYFALVAKSLCLLILFFVVFAVFMVLNTPSKVYRPQLPSDVLFGEIPWHTVVLENDQKFIDDQFTDKILPDYNDSILWSSIYPGSFVAFDNPSLGGVNGQGIQMVDAAATPSEFSESSEGFGVAVMHQLHCVKTVKRTLLELEAGMIPQSSHNHAHHCVEMLRQAVMCHSDLSLERPRGKLGHEHLSGWGDVHVCRSFEGVLKKIREQRLRRTQRGWVWDPWPSTIP